MELNLHWTLNSNEVENSRLSPSNELLQFSACNLCNG